MKWLVKKFAAAIIAELKAQGYSLTPKSITEVQVRITADTSDFEARLKRCIEKQQQFRQQFN